MSLDKKRKIAKRAEQEISNGQVINLGIGIPTLILKYLDAKKAVTVHSENGILGMGAHCSLEKADRNLIDAGGGYVELETGGAYCDSALSFALVRGGRLDAAFLGALQISSTGDLANWMIPGKYSPGIGGGMELAQKARRVVVTTFHTHKGGELKIVPECTMPLTARSCVNRIITELAVIDVVEAELHLKEIAVETSIDEVISKTGGSLVFEERKIKRF